MVLVAHFAARLGHAVAQRGGVCVSPRIYRDNGKIGRSASRNGGITPLRACYGKTASRVRTHVQVLGVGIGVRVTRPLRGRYGGRYGGRKRRRIRERSAAAFGCLSPSERALLPAGKRCAVRHRLARENAG